MPLSPDSLDSLIRGEHGDPFSILGPHAVRDAGRTDLTIRVIRPGAREIRVVPRTAGFPPQEMRLLHPAGVFEVLLSGCDKTTPAMLMGAASADVPAIMMTGGPMLSGKWRDQELGSGTDGWRLWARKRR